MQLNLGNKIRELRRAQKRTQEELATALGVTSQAVSRWEAGGSYPDMELIVPLAHFFGVTTDELFDNNAERSKKIKEIIKKVNEYYLPGQTDGKHFDECIALLRNGLAEFPGDESLTLSLASTLYETGYRRYGQQFHYDEKGYLSYVHTSHEKNEYWKETIKLCEDIVSKTTNITNSAMATKILVDLYKNIGDTKTAKKYAETMPVMAFSRQNLLKLATDGEEHSKQVSEDLLIMAKSTAFCIVDKLRSNIKSFESDMPIEKIKGAIDFINLVFEGEKGPNECSPLVSLYLYLARVQWERGYHDDAFVSLDNALEYAKAFDRIPDGNFHYKSPLLYPLVHNYVRNKIPAYAKTLPDDFPWWQTPDCTDVKKEMQADPRWDAWVKKCNE